MRKIINHIVFPVLIILSSGLMCWVTFNNDRIMINEDSLFFFKSLFAYTDDYFFRDLSLITYIAYFTCLMLCIFCITRSLYGMNSKFRSMLMFRYGSKKQFINKCNHTGKLTAILVTILLFVMPSVFTMYTSHLLPLNVDTLLLMIKIYIFFCICININMICVIKYNDVLALVSVLMLTNIIFNIDIAIDGIALITYSVSSNQIENIMILIISHIMISITRRIIINKVDIL